MFHKSQRVRTKVIVERFPHFVVPCGKLGTIVSIGQRPSETSIVQMDEAIKGCEDWNNQVHCHTLTELNSDFSPEENVDDGPPVIVGITLKNTGPLIVLLNSELRNKGCSLAHAEAYNQLFHQLTGKDHESMANRRAKANKTPLSS
jgi:hypothetical protein